MPHTSIFKQVSPKSDFALIFTLHRQHRGLTFGPITPGTTTSTELIPPILHGTASPVSRGPRGPIFSRDIFNTEGSLRMEQPLGSQLDRHRSPEQEPGSLRTAPYASETPAGSDEPPIASTSSHANHNVYSGSSEFAAIAATGNMQGGQSSLEPQDEGRGHRRRTQQTGMVSTLILLILLPCKTANTC